MDGRHGVPARGSDTVPLGATFKPGKFGRLFPDLEAFRPPTAALVALGQAMRDAAPTDPEGDNPDVPAGYTYLGQLVDHDITFDTTPITEAAIDPLAVDNFRSPKLDLDCLYGLGPAGQPYLYTRASQGTKFLIGRNRPSRDVNPNLIIPGRDNDLPRSAPGGLLVGERLPTAPMSEGFALIGDPRNDENLIVAQLHLAFLKLHNLIVDQVVARGVAPGLAFQEARRLVTWHYQWIVLHDFLPRVIDRQVLADVLTHGRTFFAFEDYAFIPIEFSVAAYRLGHSMVREQYSYNRVFNADPISLGPATLDRLFRFTGLSGGDVAVPSNWIVDWRRFFDGLPKVPGFRTHFNLSRKLDPFVTGALHELPLAPADPIGQSLPIRNLVRGVSVGLPSGQAVAARMRLPVLTPDQIAGGPDGQVARAQGFDRVSPLWYYVLKEAQLAGGGLRLGPVGSRILAEVFVGLLQGDRASFLAREPGWRPTLPRVALDTFTMADLLTLVAEINPLGD
jgi:hypothetical protein